MRASNFCGGIIIMFDSHRIYFFHSSIAAGNRGLRNNHATYYMTNIDLHNLEIQRNLRNWNRKPLLRETYKSFYEMIAGQLTDSTPGLFGTRLMVVLEKTEAG